MEVSINQRHLVNIDTKGHSPSSSQCQTNSHAGEDHNSGIVRNQYFGCYCY